LGAILTLFGAISTVLSAVRYASNSTTVGLADIGILGVSSIVSILALVGFILFMVAMHGFSRDYGERRIFSYLIYGFAVTIAAAIIILVSWIALVIANVLPLVWNINTSEPATSTQIQTLITPYLPALMIAISIAMIVWILANYKALNLLAEKTEVQHFRTTARLFLFGATVNIAIAATLAATGYFSTLDYNTILIGSMPGAAIQYIGWVVAAKGFYSIKTPPPTYAPQTYATPAAPSKYCTHCGAQNQFDAIYCERCGQKL
jgi:uncharacterized membrane protein